MLARHVLPVARAFPGPLVGALAPAGPPGNEVVGALPAAALAEHGAERQEPLEERARPEGPAPLALVGRELERVVVAVHLARLLGDVAPVGKMGAEAADVQLPDVDRGLALEDPLGHDAPDTARARDPVDRHARRHPEARPPRDRAQGVVPVRREAVGPVDQLDDLGLLDGREAADRPGEQRLEQLPLAGEELLRELPGHVVEAPRPRVGLEPPDEVPADLLADVDEVVGIPHDRGLAGKLPAGDRARDEVLVHQGNDRQVDAGHRRHAGRPLAGGIDDALRPDRPGGRLDALDAPPSVEPDAGHPRPGDDLGPLRHGPASQLPRDAVRLEVSVVRHVHRAVEALRAHDRTDPERLAGRDDPHVEPERPGPAHAALEPRSIARLEARRRLPTGRQPAASPISAAISR